MLDTFFHLFKIAIISIFQENQEDILVEKCSNGDAEAESALAEMYLTRMIVSVSHRMKGSPEEDIEDIVQDTLMEAFSQLDKLKDKNKFSVWIDRIAHNHCVDYMKRQSRQIEMIPLENEYPQEGIDLPSEKPLPDEIVVQKELVQQVRRAIKILPLNYREIVNLRELQGFSYQDIAKILEVKLPTVKNWLHRARKQLRRNLEVTFPREKERKEVS